MGDNAAGGQAQIVEDTVEIDRDRFLELVEGDLWRRFEKRLWGIVSVVLAIVTIAGLFGIPYYIRNETRSIFQEQTRRLDEENRKFISLTKAYFSLHSQYLEYEAQLRHDMRTAARDAEAFEENNEKMSTFGRLSSFLNRIADEQSPGTLLDKPMFQSHLSMVNSSEYEGLSLAREMIHIENQALDSASSSSTSHPFRDGTVPGLLEDIKFRLLIASAYEGALHSLHMQIVELGGTDPLSKQTRKLEADSAINTVFAPLFDQELLKNSTNVTFDAAEGVDESNVRNSSLFKYLAHYASEAGINATELGSIEKVVVSAARKNREQRNKPGQSRR